MLPSCRNVPTTADRINAGNIHGNTSPKSYESTKNCGRSADLSCTFGRFWDGYGGQVREWQRKAKSKRFQMQDRIVGVDQSWMACDEEVGRFVLGKIVFFHQGTDRITSHQDWWDVFAVENMRTDDILGTMPTVSIHGLQHSWGQQAIAFTNITGQDMDFEWKFLEQMARSKLTGGIFGPTMDIPWGRTSMG